jgi:hypothetical protein
LRIGDVSLAAGEYVLGFKHDGEAVQVKIYESRTGQLVGAVQAQRLSRMGRIESFHIFPPSEHATIAIGRFGFGYQILP